MQSSLRALKETKEKERIQTENRSRSKLKRPVKGEGRITPFMKYDTLEDALADNWKQVDRGTFVQRTLVNKPVERTYDVEDLNWKLLPVRCTCSKVLRSNIIEYLEDGMDILDVFENTGLRKMCCRKTVMEHPYVTELIKINTNSSAIIGNMDRLTLEDTSKNRVGAMRNAVGEIPESEIYRLTKDLDQDLEEEERNVGGDVVVREELRDFEDVVYGDDELEDYYDDLMDYDEIYGE